MFANFDINFIIFGVMPYVALTVFLVGSIARYERDPFTWKSSSSQLVSLLLLLLGLMSPRLIHMITLTSLSLPPAYITILHIMPSTIAHAVDNTAPLLTPNFHTFHCDPCINTENPLSAARSQPLLLLLPSVWVRGSKRRLQ